MIYIVIYDMKFILTTNNQYMYTVTIGSYGINED